MGSCFSMPSPALVTVQLFIFAIVVHVKWYPHFGVQVHFYNVKIIDKSQVFPKEQPSLWDGFIPQAFLINCRF